VRWPEACLARSACENIWGAEQTTRCTANQQAAAVSAAKASSAHPREGLLKLILAGAWPGLICVAA